MKYINILIIILLLSVSQDSFAQKKRKKPVGPPAPAKIEDLPRRPVDTVKTADPETKVIIFSNNTWEFYRPNISSRLANHDAYKFNWDTASIFSYRNVSFEDIPSSVNLRLVDSLNTYSTPTVGYVTSKFGIRRRRPHNGVDIPLRTGEPILATFDGKVRYAKFNSGGYGYLVIVRHPNGLETWYAHLSKVNVKVNGFVKSGQIIGFGGSTGRSSGPHLHYEMRYKDQAFDPEFIIDFSNGQLRNERFTLEKRYLNIKSRASEVLEEDDDADDPTLPGSLLTNVSDSTAVNIQKPQPAPKPKAPPATAVYHTVKSGDTLGHIAMKYGVSVDKICQLNGIKRTTTLQLGKRIRVK